MHKKILFLASIAAALSVSLGSIHAQTSTATPSASSGALPMVSVMPAIVYGPTVVSMYGNITSIGSGTVTERGFEYGLTTSYTGSIFNFGSYGTGAYAMTASFSCGTTYHYRAYAVNASGKGVSSDTTFTTDPCPTSSPTPTATMTASPSPDLISPTVSISNPSVNTTYTTAQTIAVGATASDNIGVTKVEFYRDGVMVSSDTTSPYSWDWPVTSSSNGAYTVTAKAYDAANNSMTSSPRTITISIPTATPTSTVTPTSTASPTSSPVPSPLPAPAAPPVIPLSGWAWSSNIGWISFSSSNANANTLIANPGLWKMAYAAGEPYGVYMSTSTSQPTIAKLSGYAWSSNIGWIKFDGLSNYPASGTGTEAQVQLGPTERGKVWGWIRACAGTLTGDCSTMEPRTDGWDGWIELSGFNHISPDPNIVLNPTPGPTSTAVPASNAGVFFNPLNGYFSGYAWGSDVVGWVKFNPSITLLNGAGVQGGNCNIFGTCPSSSTFTATCQIPAEATIQPGDSTVTVTRNMTYSGGSAPYTLNPASLVLSAGTYTNVVVQVTDSASRTTSANCGNIRVINPENSLELRIGRDGGTATVRPISNPLKVAVGSLFMLEWDNSLPVYDPATDMGYECSNYIEPVVSSWKDAWDNTVGNSIGDLVANKTGLYEFKIICNYPSELSNSTSSASYLRVMNVSETEI